jgi:hypothetical protein
VAREVDVGDKRRGSPSDPFDAFLLVSRYHNQIDDDRSFRDRTTPTKP